MRGSWKRKAFVSLVEKKKSKMENGRLAVTSPAAEAPSLQSERDVRPLRFLPYSWVFLHHDRDHAALPTVSRITGVLNPIPPEGIGSGPVINVKETGDVKIRTTWVEMCFFPTQHLFFNQVFFLKMYFIYPCFSWSKYTSQEYLRYSYVTGILQSLF